MTVNHLRVGSNPTTATHERSGMDDAKLISIFADSDVWIRVEVLQDLLDSDNLKEAENVADVIVALKETISYIEKQTIISISNNMLDSPQE